MKIAFLIEALGHGGCERMTSIIANELVRRHGAQVDIITVRESEPFFELDERIGLMTLIRGRDNTLHYRHLPRYMSRLRRIARRERYDYLINVRAYWAAMSIPAIAGLGTKIITWEHSNSRDKSRIGHLPRWMSSFFAHKVVVLTEESKRIWERKFHARNVNKIVNPLTIDAGKPSPLKDKRFLALGRLSHEKGFDMLLDAWALTRCREQGWSLRIVGSGSVEHELREQVERLGIGGSVEILPGTKDVADMYANASVYVLSSRYEGFGLVLVEAAAMGLPAISFDCECGPREIVEDGATGVLIPAENVPALAAAMDDMAADEEKRTRMGAAALERSRLFSIDNILPQWIELLTEKQR